MLIIFEYFEPNLQSFIQIGYNQGIFMMNYGNKYTFAQFITEELDGFLNKGYDLKFYYMGHTPPYYNFTETIANFKRKCPKFKAHINEYGEFYIENLRFTVNEDFS